MSSGRSSAEKNGKPRRALPARRPRGAERPPEPDAAARAPRERPRRADPPPPTVEGRPARPRPAPGPGRPSPNRPNPERPSPARPGAERVAPNQKRQRPPPIEPPDELDEWSTQPVRDNAARFGRRPTRPVGLRDEVAPREGGGPRHGNRSRHGNGPREDFGFGEGAPHDDSGPGGPRRPLSHVGGRVERLEGPGELRAIIQRALDIDPEYGVRDHVHGFHSYPARLHPVTAGNLVEQLSPERGSVGDPFCGCGTVLVEARRMGRKAIGVDLNPLAVRLTRFKTQPLAPDQRDELLAAAARVSEYAEERRVASAGPTHRYAPAERDAFDVHVLLELDGLAHGIKQELPGWRRQALGLALSSIFSKVGRDNSAEGPSKRIASGFTIRFFEARVGELVRQLAEYEALLPKTAPGAQVREADARQLGDLGLRNVDLFVSSPPYPGVLDYAEYHRTRLNWLNIDATAFEQLEMGARRHLQRLDHEKAAATWENDFAQVLRAMRAALAPGGHIALVLADSLLAGRPYPADVVVERCASRAGLELVARGSQRRPHFHRQSSKVFGDRARYEHLLLLAPSPA